MNTCLCFLEVSINMTHMHGIASHHWNARAIPFDVRSKTGCAVKVNRPCNSRRPTTEINILFISMIHSCHSNAFDCFAFTQFRSVNLSVVTKTEHKHGIDTFYLWRWIGAFVLFYEYHVSNRWEYIFNVLQSSVHFHSMVNRSFLISIVFVSVWPARRQTLDTKYVAAFFLRLLVIIVGVICAFDMQWIGSMSPRVDL